MPINENHQVDPRKDGDDASLDPFHGLEGDERAIAEMVLERLREGRARYGRWDVNDHRENVEEALEEVVDAFVYAAAARTDSAKTSGAVLMPAVHRRVYVAHPYADDPFGNKLRVRLICRALANKGLVPVAPQLWLHQIFEEDTERDRILDLCERMLAGCDEVRVYGSQVTSGVRREIDAAERLGIPVRFISGGRA